MEQDTTQAKSGRTSGGADTEAKPLTNRTHEATQHMRSAAQERIGAAQDATDTMKARTALRVREWGARVRKIGEHMRVEDQDYIAERAERASRQLEDVAGYVETADLGALLRDGEDLARRKPLVFFGGALLLGVAAGRVFKGTGSSVFSEASQSEPRAQLPAATTSRDAR